MATAPLYTSKTASLKATKIDTSDIRLKGKNILEYIKENNHTLKHTKDTREEVTENDLWCDYIEMKDGEYIIHEEDEIIVPVGEPKENYGSYGYVEYYYEYNWKSDITKIENNKVYVGDDLYCNLQTNKIKNGEGGFKYVDVEMDIPESEGGGTYFEQWPASGSIFFNSELETFDSDLSSLENGELLFGGCNKLTSFSGNLNSLKCAPNMFTSTQITSFSSELPSLEDGSEMFMFSNISSFETKSLPNLIYGCGMFGRSNLTDIDIYAEKMIDGSYMFGGCSSLKNARIRSFSLTFSDDMFVECRSLESVSVDCGTLISANNMFNHCENLVSWQIDGNLSDLRVAENMFLYCSKAGFDGIQASFPSIKNGNGMFAETSDNIWAELMPSNSFKNLESGIAMFRNSCFFGGETDYYGFSFDMSKLENGCKMFENTQMHQFKGDLSKLWAGYDMFKGCHLTSESVEYILCSIPQHSGPGMEFDWWGYDWYEDWGGEGYLYLGIDCEDTDEARDAFAKEAGWSDWADMFAYIDEKNWSVQFEFSPFQSPWSRRIGNTSSSKIWAKLIEVKEPSEEIKKKIEKRGKKFELKGDYKSSDETKFYNLHTFHTANKTDGYTQFDSIEDAISHFDIVAC